MAFHDLPQSSMDFHLAFSTSLGFPEVSYWLSWGCIWALRHLFMNSFDYLRVLHHAPLLVCLISWSSAWFPLAVFRVWRSEYCLSVTRVPLRSLSVFWRFGAWWLLNQVFLDLVRFFSHSQFLQCTSHFLSIITYAAAMLDIHGEP